MASALPKNILSADEDDLRNIHTALLLKRLEYNVFVASSGPDFIRVATRIIPNLILLDLKMPFAGGESSLEKLRSDSFFRMIKVVTVSEASGQRALEESLKRGADAYLLRPLHPTVLYNTIQKLTEPRPRQIPRLRVVFKVTLFTGHTGRSCFATMISEQGMFVRTVNPLAAGTRMKLSIELPSARPLVLEGEVIYGVARDKDEFVEPGMGVKFVNVDKGVKDAIKNFVEEQLTVDLDRDSLI